MIKIFTLIFVFFTFLFTSYASEDIKIISREEWWANESYRYIYWPEWGKILKKRDMDNNEWIKKLSNMSESKRNRLKQKSKQKAQKIKDINNILINDYYNDNHLVSNRKYYNNNRLAWPITKTNHIWWIIIHHTLWEYKDSATAVRAIYKYHALTRQWWDIWYNYLIWKNGEIFEWRAGWDYVVWAQSIWNNRSTLWIAMIWDYSKKPISDIQYKTLDKLVRYLIKKYNIDVLKKFTFHKECLDKNCIQPIKSFLLPPIIWHRDSWHTECPWDALYSQIYLMSNKIIKEKKDYIYTKIYLVKAKKLIKKKVEKMSENSSLKLLEYIEERLDRERNKQNIEILVMIKWIIKSKFLLESIKQPSPNRSQRERDIKVKLSYPRDDKIVIKSRNKTYNITKRWNTLITNNVVWNSVFKVDWKSSEYLEISSWDRKPIWDTSWKYNDNKFKGDLIVYIKRWKMIVVNKLKVQEYLKWLWEVSDNEKTEKIKTIIIASRSYAQWYSSESKKFKWEWYDWSDNPDEFQKYLWYGLEQRSPNINRIVDETYWEVITYNNKLIKPWYSSSSWGNTKSFIRYCEIKYEKTFCKQESKKYPYLLSVKDPWAKIKKWHWVWISWVWTSYLVKKWWTAEMVIKYFLSWVEILRL